MSLVGGLSTRPFVLSFLPGEFLVFQPQQNLKDVRRIQGTFSMLPPVLTLLGALRGKVYCRFSEFIRCVTRPVTAKRSRSRKNMISKHSQAATRKQFMGE